MFNPNYQITSKIAQALVRIELAKEVVSGLPITPNLLISLRKSARLASTHYSTQIEGNRLSQVQVEEVVIETKHFKDRERDEKEVLGYYEALDQITKWSEEKIRLNEQYIQRLHALVMGDKRIKFTPYRDGQNVIRESGSGHIIYMPPEAKDIPQMVQDLLLWLEMSKIEGVPDPIRASIVHYQFATIHPYYDGNGRMSRLLTNLVLYLGGYDLKGIYSLEEYYAQRLDAYYAAITIGNSHNYYEGRAEADITGWVEYFCEGMAKSFEDVKNKAQSLADEEVDQSDYLKNLDPRKKEILKKYNQGDKLYTKDIQDIFNIGQRNASYLAQKWVKEGFLMVVDESKKNRIYKIDGNTI
jgi:Fic family protein